MPPPLVSDFPDAMPPSADPRAVLLSPTCARSDDDDDDGGDDDAADEEGGRAYDDSPSFEIVPEEDASPSPSPSVESPVLTPDDDDPPSAAMAATTKVTEREAISPSFDNEDEDVAPMSPMSRSNGSADESNVSEFGL